ncbi:MAG: hypothetical protein ACPIOQ_27350 [Promethearchaeia archaeon]
MRKSKIVITGVPTKDYKLPTEWVQPGTIVINVSHFKNVDEDALLTVPGVKYVPLVGKVTVAMLERNLIRLINQFQLEQTGSGASTAPPLSSISNTGGHLPPAEYLEKHGVRDKLCALVKQLAIHQPPNPLQYLEAASMGLQSSLAT